MTKLLNTAFVGCLLLAAVPALCVAETSERCSAETQQRLTAYLKPLADSGHFSGGVKVLCDGATLLEEYHGYASREPAIPWSAETRSDVASITKGMTKIIAYHLFETAGLNPQATISEWLPDFPKGDQITLSMLIYHQAGLPHRVTGPELQTSVYSTQEMVDKIANSEWVFEPGTDAVYSSAGYTLLTHLLQLASGKTYEQLLSEVISQPLGLSHTNNQLAIINRPDQARPMALTSGGDIEQREPESLSYLNGAGSVFSNVTDLATLGAAILTDDFGKKAAEFNNWADGFDWNGRTREYRAFLDGYPEDELVIALTANMLSGAADLIRRDFPLIVRGEDIPPPHIPVVSPRQLKPEDVEPILGSYESRPGSNIEASFDNGNLMVSGWLLIAIDNLNYFSPQDYGEVSFQTSVDGEVTGLNWKTVDGTNYFMPKVE